VDKILIRVGSLSEHKIGAVRDACEALKIDADVAGVQCSSGVPEQPLGQESVDGALNRAEAAGAQSWVTFATDGEDDGTNEYYSRKREAFKKHTAMFIGIENGIGKRSSRDDRWYDVAYVVGISNTNKRYESSSAALEVNGEDVVRAQFRGFDKNTVASVTAERTGCDPNDATPYYTGGRVTRRELLAQAVKVVLAQWLADEERRVRAS